MAQRIRIILLASAALLPLPGCGDPVDVEYLAAYQRAVDNACQCHAVWAQAETEVIDGAESMTNDEMMRVRSLAQACLERVPRPDEIEPPIDEDPLDPGLRPAKYKYEESLREEDREKLRALEREHYVCLRRAMDGA